MSTTQLIEDVGALPAVIGDMGLAIAQAQTLLDHNYLDGIQRLAALVRSMLGTDVPGAAAPDAEKIAAAREVMTAALRALAPTRYQYTETTLTVRLDMARSVQAAANLGVGASFGAVVVNAALTLGYAFDYRGAAEVKAVIHAAPAGEAVFDTLLKRAATINDTALSLPAPAKLDQAMLDKAKEIFTMISGKTPAAITSSAAPAG
jgi:hypothetical protein